MDQVDKIALAKEFIKRSRITEFNAQTVAGLMVAFAEHIERTRPGGISNRTS